MLRCWWTYVCILFLGQALLLSDLWISAQCSVHNGGRELPRYPEEIPDRYDQSVLTLFTFLGWKRKLRSISTNPLYIPRVKTKAGAGTFYVAAPTVWNSIPSSVNLEGNIVPLRWCLKPFPSISLKLHILLRFLAPSSIRRQIVHCYTITRFPNPLVLSRHSSIFEDIGA